MLGKMYNLRQLSPHCAPAEVLNVESLETPQQPGSDCGCEGSCVWLENELCNLTVQWSCVN